MVNLTKILQNGALCAVAGGIGLVAGIKTLPARSVVINPELVTDRCIEHVITKRKPTASQAVGPAYDAQNTLYVVNGEPIMREDMGNAFGKLQVGDKVYTMCSLEAYNKKNEL